jgi:carbamoyl-phosphate synthase large subunit
MDYWLDHAAQGLIECGYEVVIIHNNPATPLRGRSGVRFYPEPVTGEAILDIVDRENPRGVILQGGGKAVSNLGPVFKQAKLAILDPWVDEVSGVSIPFKPDEPAQKPPEDAVGAEVICIADGESVIVCGVIEQIERAGIHSGDCAMALPPYTLEAGIVAALKEKSLQLVRESGVKGLVALRYAVEHRNYYLRRFHPRFTRNIPALSKATGIDWARAAVKTMLGITLSEQGICGEPVLSYHLAKEAVFSFHRFRGVDTLLGPQMRATGMVAGIDRDFGSAFIKSQLAAGEKIPTGGRIFLSIRDEEKRDFTAIARQFTAFGFKILAAGETENLLNRNQVPCERVANPGEGRPNILDKIKNGEIQWIISTPSASKTRPAEGLIRSVAMTRGIPIITTLAGAQAIVLGLEQYLKKEFTVRAIQD